MTRRRFLFPTAFALLMIAAFGLRAYSIEADAPHHLSVSQGLTTDGANTIYAGRNKVLFGSWSPEIEGFPAVERSQNAMDWLSYITFSALGIGYWQAGFLTLVSAMLTIAIFTAFARRYYGDRAAILAALFMTFNFVFIFLNRVPVAFNLVNLVMALVLYTMGLGRRSWIYVLIAILIAVIGIVSVKIASMAAIPMIITGAFYILNQRFSSEGILNRRVIILIGTLVLLFILFLVFGPSGNLFLSRLNQRTVNLSYELSENIRFLVVSLLEFGIYSAFFIRMLPLFVLSFGYVTFRAVQLLSRGRKNIPYAEVLMLTYLLGVAAMLLLSNQQPTRHLILLIPPMSLASAFVIDRILHVSHLQTFKNPGYLVPVVAFLGIAYLYYQTLSGIIRLTIALNSGLNVGDYAAITPMPVLHATMFVALVPAFLTTILLLAHLSGSGNWLNQILTPRRIRILIILLIVMMVVGDLLQYFSWARAPEFTTVLASRQISDDFSDEIVLGGAYAAVLGLENKIPGKLFFEIPLRENDYQQRVLESGLTHLAMESESIFGDIPINDVEMRKNAPEFVEHLELAHIYHVRGYTVNVYGISPD